MEWWNIKNINYESWLFNSKVLGTQLYKWTRLSVRLSHVFSLHVRNLSSCAILEGQFPLGSRRRQCICDDSNWSGNFCEIESPKPKWTDWGNFTDCSVSCGEGVQVNYKERLGKLYWLLCLLWGRDSVSWCVDIRATLPITLSLVGRRSR